MGNERALLKRTDDPKLEDLDVDQLEQWVNAPQAKTIEKLLERCRRLTVVRQQVADGRWQKLCEQRLRMSADQVNRHSRIYYFYHDLQPAYMQVLPAKVKMLDELRTIVDTDVGKLKQLADKGWLWPDMNTAGFSKLREHLGKKSPGGATGIALAVQCGDEAARAKLKEKLEAVAEANNIPNKPYDVIIWMADQHLPKEQKAA